MPINFATLLIFQPGKVLTGVIIAYTLIYKKDDYNRNIHTATNTTIIPTRYLQGMKKDHSVTATLKTTKTKYILASENRRIYLTVCVFHTQNKVSGKIYKQIYNLMYIYSYYNSTDSCFCVLHEALYLNNFLPCLYFC